MTPTPWDSPLTPAFADLQKSETGGIQTRTSSPLSSKCECLRRRADTRSPYPHPPPNRRLLYCRSGRAPKPGWVRASPGQRQGQPRAPPRGMRRQGLWPLHTLGPFPSWVGENIPSRVMRALWGVGQHLEAADLPPQPGAGCNPDVQSCGFVSARKPHRQVGMSHLRPGQCCG